MPKSKILITGIDGFVGRSIAKELSGKFVIYGITRNKKSLLKNYYKIFCGDLSNKFFVNKIKGNFDIIINCAANTQHYDNYELSYKDNCISLKNILLAKQIRYKKFIHISTEAVFLRKKKILINDKSKLPEQNISTYSHTKKIAEKMLEKFIKKNKVFVILRPRLIWDKKNSPVFFKLNKSINNYKFFWVNNGKYYTQATHINNFIYALQNTIKFGKNKKKYFITDRKSISFKNLIFNIYSKKFFTISIPRMIVFSFVHFTEVLFNLLSINKNYLPITMSLYYLTLENVSIDDKASAKALNYRPRNYYENF